MPGPKGVRAGRYRGAMTASALPVPVLGRLPLAREAVDRGSDVRSRPGWLEQVWAESQTRVLMLSGGRAPVVDGHLVLVPARGELPEGAVYLGRSTAASPEGSEPAELVLVPAPDRQTRFDVTGAETGGAPIQDRGRIAWVGLRDVAAGLTDRDAGIFVEAVSISNWHATHTHCPRCGRPTEIVQSGWVRRCPEDGSQHFPRTDPAIIVAVTDPQNRILLGSNAAWEGRRFSTLAGFVEPGESLEAAVAREVHEESNLVVHSTQYLGSQPWPFPQSLMLGFTARTDHPEAAAEDRVEMRQVRWFTRDELVAAIESGQVVLPGAASISRALIEHWYGGTLPEPRTLQN